ncbi:hypothetical protein, partial [Streptomyces sp. NRRL F-3273]|uniref:hypothetical protein n=1 Tax=Streptomyces sp. NRRL F-3273 TaxID=1463848 RepID=UPI001F402D35
VVAPLLLFGVPVPVVRNQPFQEDEIADDPEQKKRADPRRVPLMSHSEHPDENDREEQSRVYGHTKNPGR